jgi:hypothetical protein
MDFTLTVQQGDMPPLKKRFLLPALAMLSPPPWWYAAILNASRQREERRARDMYLAKRLGELVGIPSELTSEQASAMMGAIS